MWSGWLVFCDYGFSVSALWCPLATPTILLGLLLPWMWGLSSWLLQQSTATFLTLDKVSPPDLERGVAPLSPPGLCSHRFLDVGLLLSAAAPDLRRGVNIVQMAESIHRLDVISIKLPTIFLTELQQIILKFIWNHKILRIAKAILRGGEDQAGGRTVSDFRQNYKGTVVKTCGIGSKTDILISRTE